MSDPWQLCVHLMLVQFISNAVEIYCTKNRQEILCTDDVITAMNEAVNLDNVNQHHQISIKYFPIEFNIDEINKYDYVSIESIIHYIDYGNDKLDGMKTELEIYDNNNNNTIAIALPSLKSNKTIIWI